jgi:glucokinase
MNILGVDIGGTKVACGLVNDGKIEKELSINIDNQQHKDEIIAQIIQSIEEIFTPEVEGIGIGAPGLIDANNGIVYQLNNIPSWKEVYLKSIVAQHFNRPVFVNNDANCFAVGEKYFGKGLSFDNLVGIVMGTGMGAGIIANNRLYGGVNCGAGEFGSIPVNGKLQEYYCSGQFFKNEYNTTGAELFALASRGDARALEIFDAFGTHVGNTIKLVMYTLAPQAIILGGSVSKSFCFFKDAMWKSVAEFPFKKVTENLIIEQSEIKDVAILGAAALCLDGMQK